MTSAYCETFSVDLRSMSLLWAMHPKEKYTMYSQGTKNSKVRNIIITEQEVWTLSC